MRTLLSPILPSLDDFPGLPLRTTQQRLDTITFTCSCCGRGENGLTALTRLMPDSIFTLSLGERDARARTSPDLAALDAERFFIRAVLALPVQRTTHALEFGVWAEVSKADFKLYFDEYDNPAPQFGPLACSLDSDLRPYDATAGLKGFLTMQTGGRRPLMWFDSAAHRLARDQADGISVARLSRIYRAWGHSIRL